MAARPERARGLRRAWMDTNVTRNPRPKIDARQMPNLTDAATTTVKRRSLRGPTQDILSPYICGSTLTFKFARHNNNNTFIILLVKIEWVMPRWICSHAPQCEAQIEECGGGHGRSQAQMCDTTYSPPEAKRPDRGAKGAGAVPHNLQTRCLAG